MTSKLDPQELERLSKAATQGVWEVDSEYDNDALYSGGGGCGSGFKNYFIGADVGGKWKTLLDTVNSDHKLIEEEFDEDGKHAWDVIGQANAAFIVALVNAYRTGQLVPAMPSDVDLVAEAECMKQMRETAQEMGYSDVLDALEALADIKAAQPSGDVVEAVARKFNLGDRVTKTKGSSWTGLVVGFYSTSLTPVGYAVESENEPGSVQIYPESALAALGEKP